MLLPIVRRAGAHTLAAITMTTLLLTDPANPGCVIQQRSLTSTRVCAQLRSHGLDRALASGVSPDSSAALSLRAQALISARARRALARSLQRLIEDARRPLGPFTPMVPICRRKILRSRESLEQLAARLLSGDPVDACGMAKVRLLVTDGSGPVYDRPAAEDLEPAVQQALEALEPRGWPTARQNGC
jgi:hypothetical protein